MNLFEFHQETTHQADLLAQSASRPHSSTTNLIDQLEDFAARWRAVNATPTPTLSIGVARLLSSGLISSAAELELPADAPEESTEEAAALSLNAEDEAARLRRQALATLKGKKKPIDSTAQANKPDAAENKEADQATRKRARREKAAIGREKAPKEKRQEDSEQNVRLIGGDDSIIKPQKPVAEVQPSKHSGKATQKATPPASTSKLAAGYGRVGRSSGFDVRPGDDRWTPEPSPHIAPPDKEEGELPEHMDIALHKSFSPREPADCVDGFAAQPAEASRVPEESHELPQQTVIDKMVEIVDSSGGEIPASQVVLLYRELRGSQAVVKALGGIKALCKASNDKLQFCSNGLFEHGQPCKGRPDSIRLNSDCCMLGVRAAVA